MLLVRELSLTPEAQAVARKVLDSLRFRVERLISQELSAIPPPRGEELATVPDAQLELFDADTGECIFG